MCIKVDTGAHAGPVPFLPHGSISTASECIVLIVQNKIMSWLPQACLLESSAQEGNISQ
jgi:hypothetical protein